MFEMISFAFKSFPYKLLKTNFLNVSSGTILQVAQLKSKFSKHFIMHVNISISLVMEQISHIAHNVKLEQLQTQTSAQTL